MYISTTTIINVAALVTALITIGGIIFSIFKWFQKQKQQDIDISSIKEENEEVIEEPFIFDWDGLAYPRAFEDIYDPIWRD